MSKIFCPNCYAEYEVQPDLCKCGYPFYGKEIDKYTFMTSQGKKAAIIQESINKIAYSRNILFFVGGISLLFSIIMILSNDGDNSFNFISMLYSAVLIGLGFYSYKEPFLALLLGLLVLLFIYMVMGLINIQLLLMGIIAKIGFTSALIFGLIKIRQAKKISKNESSNI